MLIDDLCAIAPDKLDGEVVKRSDLSLEPDSVRQKDGDFHSVITKVLQEEVLETWGALCRQLPVPSASALNRMPLHVSQQYHPDVSRANGRFRLGSVRSATEWTG
jgi:hypothetical protein